MNHTGASYFFERTVIMRKHSSDLINTYSFSNKKNKFWDRRKVYSLKGYRVDCLLWVPREFKPKSVRMYINAYVNAKGYPPLLIKEVENTGGNL